MTKDSEEENSSASAISFPCLVPVVNALIVGAIGLSSGILGGYIADQLCTWIKEMKEETLSLERVLSIIHEYFNKQMITLLLRIVGSSLAIPEWYFTAYIIASTDTFEIYATATTNNHLFLINGMIVIDN